MAEQEKVAVRLDAACAAAVASIRVTPAEVWREPAGEGDGRSVATVAHHIGSGLEHALEWALSIRSSGRMTGITPASIDAANAEEGQRFPVPDQDEVVAFIGAASDELATLIRSVADTQLDQPSSNVVMNRQWSLRDVFEASIRHTAGHHNQIVVAVDRRQHA